MSSWRAIDTFIHGDALLARHVSLLFGDVVAHAMAWTGSIY